MNKFYSLLLILVLIAGFYFKVMSIDPLSIVIIGILLWNNSTNLSQHQQLATHISKTHEIAVSNQKSILKAVENTRAEIRRK